MKALKHLAGILLATISTIVTLGVVTLLFEKNSDVPAWGVGIMFVLFGLLPLAGAIALLRRRATELPPVCCPRCGGGERAPAGILTRSCSFWSMHFGGWLLASLWGASREQQVRCLQCDTLYFTETRGTRIAGILLWVFILLVVFGAIAEHFQEQP